MNIKILMSINAVLMILFGLGFLVAPAWVFSLYGASTNALGLFTARAFTVWNITIGVLIWMVREAIWSQLFKSLVTILFLAYLIFFYLALQLQITRTLNMAGWLNVALYLVLAAWYAYYLIRQPTLEAE